VFSRVLFLLWSLGHAAPPGRIRFYGGQGQNILSAGQDSSLRVFRQQHYTHPLSDWKSTVLWNRNRDRRNPTKIFVLAEPERITVQVQDPDPT
jgi:hypothetical protein